MPTIYHIQLRQGTHEDSLKMWIAACLTDRLASRRQPRFDARVTMRRLAVAITLFVLLGLTVPWFFIGTSADEDPLPAWVIYALAMTVVFPIVVSILMGRFWKHFDSD